MRVLNLTIAALLALSLATPVVAQEGRYRNLYGETVPYNPPNCPPKPTNLARGYDARIMYLEGPNGSRCVWSIFNPKEEKGRLQQQRALAYTQERARADAEVRECALALVAKYNVYLHDAKLACMGAAPMPYGYSYGSGYTAPQYRSRTSPFN